MRNQQPVNTYKKCKCWSCEPLIMSKRLYWTRRYSWIPISLEHNRIMHFMRFLRFLDFVIFLKMSRLWYFFLIFHLRLCQKMWQISVTQEMWHIVGHVCQTMMTVWNTLLYQKSWHMSNKYVTRTFTPTWIFAF